MFLYRVNHCHATRCRNYMLEIPQANSDNTKYGKRSGAWMTSYKEQWIDEKTGENSRPHISIVMNFTKPTDRKSTRLNSSHSH